MFRPLETAQEMVVFRHSHLVQSHAVSVVGSGGLWGGVRGDRGFPSILNGTATSKASRMRIGVNEIELLFDLLLAPVWSVRLMGNRIHGVLGLGLV